MEGNEPSSGTPIKRGLLIAGSNPVAVDVVAGRQAGISADLLHIEQMAVSKGLKGAQFDDITLYGQPLESMPAMYL